MHKYSRMYMEALINVDDEPLINVNDGPLINVNDEPRPMGKLLVQLQLRTFCILLQLATFRQHFF